MTIEKFRRDEAEALKRVEETTGKEREEALMAAQIATTIRKGLEQSRAIDLERQSKRALPNMWSFGRNESS